jgi:hypothetical protein
MKGFVERFFGHSLSSNRLAGVVTIFVMSFRAKGTGLALTAPDSQR